MKKIISLIIFIILFASPALILSQTATPNPENSGAVTIIGDSLTTDAGAGSRIKSLIPDVQIDARVGRPWSEGVKVVECVNDPQSDPAFCDSVSLSGFGDIVVFALGTNQGIGISDINNLLSKLPGKKVVLMTIYRGDVDWDNDANLRIRNAAENNSRILIADWSSLATQHPEWFGSDGTHPSTSGYTALADLIAQTVESSSPGPTNPPNQGKSNCVITKVGNPTGPTPFCQADDLRQVIIDDFGVTMNGFEDKFLQWALEIFQASSDTNLSSLINGATVEANCIGCGGKQVGCKNETSIYLEPYDSSAAYFKFILIHELGHFIRNCQPREISKYNQHINAIYIDQYISYYAENASSCADTTSNSEDYADTIAYYINPESGHVSGPTSCPTTGRTPPNPLFDLIPVKTEHLSVAQQIL